MWRKAMVYLLQGIFYTPLKYPDHKSVRLAADIFPIQSTCQPAPIVLLSALAFAHRSSLLVVLRQSRPSTFDNKLSLHFSQRTHEVKEETTFCWKNSDFVLPSFDSISDDEDNLVSSSIAGCL